MKRLGSLGWARSRMPDRCSQPTVCEAIHKPNSVDSLGYI